MKIVWLFYRNSADLVKSIKEEWSDFIVSEGKGGALTATPPAGNGKTYKSKEEIYAIKGTAERQKAISENHELFGFYTKRGLIMAIWMHGRIYRQFAPSRIIFPGFYKKFL